MITPPLRDKDTNFGIDRLVSVPLHSRRFEWNREEAFFRFQNEREIEKKKKKKNFAGHLVQGRIQVGRRELHCHRRGYPSHLHCRNLEISIAGEKSQNPTDWRLEEASQSRFLHQHRDSIETREFGFLSTE